MSEPGAAAAGPLLCMIIPLGDGYAVNVVADSRTLCGITGLPSVETAGRVAALFLATLVGTAIRQQDANERAILETMAKALDGTKSNERN